MAIIFNIQEAVNNSAFNVLQEPIKMILENQTEAFEKNSIIDKVFVMKTTDKYREEYRSTTAMDGFKPTEDMEVAGLSDFEESYNKQFVFQTWTNSFVVSKQTIEDNQMMSIEPKAMGFIKGYGRTRENYAVRMISAALGNTYADYKIVAASGKGMDTTDGSVEGTKQQYFHNQHHKLGHTGTGVDDVQSNKFYADLSFTDDPLLEEKILDVLGQVESKMKKYTDDKGNILTIEPTRLVIAEDYSLKDALERALKSKYGSPMGGNGVNTQYGRFELIVNSYLSGVTGFADTDHAILFIDPERNREGLGATWFDRTPLQVRSYIDDNTEANVWAGRSRFGAGFGDFRAMAYISLSSGNSANATQITPAARAMAVNVTNTTTKPVNTKTIAD